MLYRAPARIRADGAVPPTHMLFRCSIARIRVHSGGRNRPAAKAVDALLRFRAYILVFISIVRRGAHRKTMQSRSVEPRAYPSRRRRGAGQGKQKDGAARRPPRLPAVRQYGRKAVRLRARQSGACGPDWGDGRVFPPRRFRAGGLPDTGEKPLSMDFYIFFFRRAGYGIRRVLRKKGAAPSRICGRVRCRRRCTVVSHFCAAPPAGLRARSGGLDDERRLRLFINGLRFLRGNDRYAEV